MQPEERTDWHSWLWRALGGTILGTLVLLMVTLFNYQNTNVSTVQCSVNELKQVAGKLEAEINGFKERMDKLEKFQIENSKGYKESDKDLQKQISDAREKVVALEAKLEVMKPEEKKKVDK